MKKIFTLIVALVATTTVMAQAQGPMTFAGKASFYVTNPQTGGQMGNTDVVSDTVTVQLKGMTSADISMPSIKYGQMVIPAFTITNTTCAFAGTGATWSQQTFSLTASDGKTITGSALAGAYAMASKSLDLTITFTYGSMIMPITYTIKGYYVKGYTDNLTACIGGSVNYTYQATEKVTYNVRAYVDDNSNKLMDVQVPACSFTNTQMGDLYLGSYTIKGLTYDATNLTYTRDYTEDGDSVYFKGISLDKYCKLDKGTDASQPHVQKITVTVDAKGAVTKIVNQLQPGTMPWTIVYTFPDTKTGIESVSANTSTSSIQGATYNLAGQRVSANAKGIIIRNGRKYFVK